MEINLPHELIHYVEMQVARRNFASASDFLCSVIRERKDALARIDHQVEWGLQSGWSSKSFEDIIAEAGSGRF
jgi:Arc/MetJ-type ribon-helix-helix transcriptional regulator